MKDEKAIEIMQDMKNHAERTDDKELMDACDTAIKALETVSCIKEKCAYCPHCENCDVDDETLEIKTLEQQPCEDWYDVPSDEMTLEQARQAVKDLRKKLAEYLEQQPCEDCISRQAVLEVLKKNRYRFNISQEGYCEGKVLWGENLIKDNAYNEIEQLPPVTPKEKTGKMRFILNGCDISFIAEAPEDMTVKQLVEQADRIKPDWCACGICKDTGYEKCPAEIVFDYNSVRKVSDDVCCEIRQV